MVKKLQLERIDPSLSAEIFFSKYVSKRKPVILKSLIDDPTFKGRKWVDLHHLSRKAGNVDVMVEPIHPTANQYGTDIERIPMPFDEFLDSLTAGKGSHPYLTTQYADSDDPDETTVFPPPTNALKDEFPTVPRIMGNLFLQQVNLWIGKSKEGSSSGLHHDFHDNLYCLLQGRKRFVLFPPSEVKNLYPFGTLDVLHSNGLISYEDIPVRADGLSKRAACKARVRALERKIEALRDKSKGKGKTHSKELKSLVDAHDEALDELAMLALDAQEDGDEIDDFDALMSGLDDVDAELAAGPSDRSVNGRNGRDESSEEEEEEEEWRGIGHSDNDSPDDDSSDDDGDDASDQRIKDKHETDDENDDFQSDAHSSGLEDGMSEPSEPSSFSRIPTAHLHSYLGIPTTAALPPSFSASEFPGLRKATTPYVVELFAGEMLYLPASWWHEVTSTSSNDNAKNVKGAGTDVHMAFNYWFYPPDSLENFSAPYADELVWDYLRGKGSDGTTSVEELIDTPVEKVKIGKRVRESSGGGRGKKAKR